MAVSNMRGWFAILLATLPSCRVGIAPTEDQHLFTAHISDVPFPLPQFRNELAWSCNLIGDLLSWMGKLTKALARLEQERTILEALTAANPDVTEFQRDLARTHSGLGDFLSSRTGQPAEAILSFERRRAYCGGWSKQTPASQSSRRELAISLHAVGNALKAQGRLGEAAESYRKAVAILEGLSAVIVVDHYNLACIHALLAGVAARPGSGVSAIEGQVEADHSMIWLRKAVNGGVRDLAGMQIATDLDALRNRPTSKP